MFASLYKSLIHFNSLSALGERSFPFEEKAAAAAASEWGNFALTFTAPLITHEHVTAELRVCVCLFALLHDKILHQTFTGGGW